MYMHKWMFPKIGVPQNGWFIIENPIKMDDLGVPLFLETPKSTKKQTSFPRIQAFENLLGVYPDYILRLEKCD